MKIFDKKLLIILIFFCIILCIVIFFFTKDNSYEFISQNEFYIQNTSEVISDEPQLIVIHIEGAVLYPGLITLPIEARISDAIKAAGGATSLADFSKINLAYELKDGQKIYIPSINDTSDKSYIQNDAGFEVVLSDDASILINLNSATETELDTLTGIGPSTAKRIIEYRNKNGDFKKIEDIMNVSGIGESKFNSIKDFICI